jgi:hypothetical protein
MYTLLKCMVAVVVVAAAFIIAGPSVPAQTTTAAPKVPTTATPLMIEEAIQRSQARSEKLRTLGRPEQWGSEEPFTMR